MVPSRLSSRHRFQVRVLDPGSVTRSIVSLTLWIVPPLALGSTALFDRCASQSEASEEALPQTRSVIL